MLTIPTSGRVLRHDPAPLRVLRAHVGPAHGAGVDGAVAAHRSRGAGAGRGGAESGGSDSVAASVGGGAVGERGGCKRRSGGFNL